MYAIIHTIEPFDSSLGTEIKFTWRGNQIFKVRCIIKNNETGAMVYDQIENTMKQSYIIPPNSGLVNGTYYVAYITVFDVNNIESDLQSVGTPFYCLSKPTFNLSVSDGGIVQTSSYSVGVNYSQMQNEPLDSYNVALYTYQKTQLSSSGEIYNTSEMSYVISGLENAKQYYLRATGKTLHGINLDTGYILITVSYTIAQVFNILELNNKTESGAIEIKGNIVSAIGISEKDVVYIGNEYADLRDNSVTFEEGFEVRGDFTKLFIFYEPERNKSIISFGDGDNFIADIYYRIGSYSDSNGEKAYFELVANSCGINYVMSSNYVEVPSPYQQFALLVNRQGSYYEMKVVLISQHIRYSPNPDGTSMTETRQPNSLYVGVGYMPKEVMEHENLFVNTNQNNKLPKTPWKSATTGGIDVSWEDIYKLRLTANRVVDPQYRPLPAYTDIPMGPLSFSFKYTTSIDRGSSVRFRVGANGAPSRIKLESNVQNGTFSQLLESPVNDYTQSYISIDPGAENNISVIGSYISVWDLKLERGTEATPWTPAPSDWVSDPSNYEWVAINERR